MKITAIIPNSHQCLNRLIQLQGYCPEVDWQIINLRANKKEVCNLPEDDFSDFSDLSFDPGNSYQKLLKLVTGDIIYTWQANPLTCGISISLKQQLKKKLIIDLPRIELNNVFPYTENKLKGFSLSAFQFFKPQSYLYTFITEKRINLADQIIVSNSALEDYYGGIIIPEQANIEIFNSNRYKTEEIRKNLNWTEQKTILVPDYFPNYQIFRNTLEQLNKFKSSEYKFCFLVRKEWESKAKGLIGNENEFYIIQPLVNQAKLIAAADYILVYSEDSPEFKGFTPPLIDQCLNLNKTIIAHSSIKNNNLEEVFKVIWINDWKADLEKLGAISNSKLDKSTMKSELAQTSYKKVLEGLLSRLK